MAPTTKKESLIHKFKFQDLHLLLDINSGGTFVIDEPAWAVLDEYCRLNRAEIIAYYKDRYGEGAVADAYDEIASMEQDGLLFTADPLADTYRPAGTPVIKALCLHVAHDCNLRCRYCFADAGEFRGQREIMSREVARAAQDFLLVQSGTRKYLEVDFFGGEPLMNMDVVRDAVAYGREREAAAGKEFRFTLTTNGVLLNQENRDYLKENRISVVLSLDGRPEVNDRMRPYAGGQGSYATILPNIQAMVKMLNHQGYYVRGTFTRANPDFAKDVEHLADLGFTEISVEPVVGAADEPYALTPDLLPLLEQEYDRLAAFYQQRRREGRPFNFFHFKIDTAGGPCLPKRLIGCGAGSEYLAVTPTGDLYPCHQFVGRTQYRLGSVFTGVERPELVEVFRQAHIYNKPQCRECWARFYCSGGCHANANAFGGSIFRPYDMGCALEKKRLECALGLDVLARLADENQSVG